MRSYAVKIKRFLGALWFIILQPRLAPREPSIQPDRSWRADIDGVPVIHLSGSSYQRGFQHGQLLKPELDHFRVVAWQYAAESAHKRMGLPLWLARYITKPLLLFLSALHISKLDMDVCAEMQGIADGASAPLREVIASMAIWEVFGMLGAGGEHCSEFAISSEFTTDGPLLGYNYDVIDPGDRAVVEGFLALFIVHPTSGLSYVAPNTIGTPGLNTAMNAEGVAFGWDNSYLRQGVTGSQESRPFMVLLREVALSCRTATDAMQYIRGEARPQADICVVADTTSVGAVEIAGYTSATRSAPVVWSCNRLQSLEQYDYLGAGRPFDGRPHRYAALLGELKTPITISDVAGVLRDSGAPEGRQIAGKNTCFTVIYQPRTQRLWISFRGSPSANECLLAFDANGKRHPEDDILPS